LPRVLIVDDQQALLDFLVPSFVQAGWTATEARSGPEALEQLDRDPFDLLVLDLSMPGMDGLDVCRRVRERPDYLPIIMLTARGDTVDRVVGLELGADDYVVKPFEPRELIARAKALLRLRHATSRPAGSTVSIDELEIDLDGRNVRLAGQELTLTPKEFELLAVLARRPGWVYGPETLLDEVWSGVGDAHLVAVTIARLRQKLDAPAATPFIETVRGFGYRLRKPA
jgi:DNA-binding response OmpR family regulator